MKLLSLQDRFAPKSICFGCGPSNPQGLKIKSYEEGEIVIAEWVPGPHHEAFPGILNGGIVGALLDCHSNWAAAMHLMKKNRWERPHATVTAKYSVELLGPVPSKVKLELSAKVIESSERRATVEADLSVGGEIRAVCTGTFVAVKPDHPAFHRWE